MMGLRLPAAARRLCLVAAVLATAAPALAAQYVFSGYARGELGYETNPFLREGEGGGAAYGGFTIAPDLAITTSRSMTDLSATYYRQQYFDHYRHSDTLTGGVRRTDNLSPFLVSTVTFNYTTSNSYLAYDAADPILIDPLSVGQRTHSYIGTAGLQWQASARDVFNLSGDYTHSSNGGETNIYSNSYSEYGGTFGYSRILDARTNLGAQVRYSQSDSRVFPNSRSIEPSITAKRQLNAVWTVNGHLGVVNQRIDGPLGGSFTTVGFGLSLCANYPRSSVCLNADRGSEPSLYSTARIQTTVGLTATHSLDEHNRVSLSSFYSQSDSRERLGPAIADSSKTFQVNADYDRDISRRLSAGVEGRYRTLDSSIIHANHSVAASVHISARFGHI